MNGVCEPKSKRTFADWRTGTALGRITRIRAAALDHRRFWDAMDAVTVEQLEEIEAALTKRMIEDPSPGRLPRRAHHRPLFITQTGRRLDQPEAWRMIRRLARRASLDGATKIRPHSLRVAFITGAFD